MTGPNQPKDDESGLPMGEGQGARFRHDFNKLNRLPPYSLGEVIELMRAARRAGEDIIDLGMGNPDLPTPVHITDKIVEATRNPRNHRYSQSRGIPNLRAGICEWYERRHGVQLDPDSEAIAVIGAKEGLSHFVLMTIGVIKLYDKRLCVVI